MATQPISPFMNNVWPAILSYLQDPKDLGAAIKTCKVWNQAFKNSNISNWPKVQQVQLLVGIKNQTTQTKTLTKDLSAHLCIDALITESNEVLEKGIALNERLEDLLKHNPDDKVEQAKRELAVQLTAARLQCGNIFTFVVSPYNKIIKLCSENKLSDLPQER